MTKMEKQLLQIMENNSRISVKEAAAISAIEMKSTAFWLLLGSAAFARFFLLICFSRMAGWYRRTASRIAHGRGRKHPRRRLMHVNGFPSAFAGPSASMRSMSRRWCRPF